MKRSVSMVFIILMVFSSGIKTSAQLIDSRKDFEIINKALSGTVPDPYKRNYLYKDEHSLMQKINPVHLVLGGTMYVYQNILSKQISANCLYTPSCSEFSKDAIREYGVLKGVVLTVDRVNRCNIISVMDLKNHRLDPATNRYPDSAARYKKVKNHDGN